MQAFAERQIKGLPAGWSFQRYFQRTGDERSNVVLCERLPDYAWSGDHGTQYVVWTHNAIEGGCFHGFYTDDAAAAGREYNRRVKRC